jgi:hypothetical protein
MKCPVCDKTHRFRHTASPCGGIVRSAKDWFSIIYGSREKAPADKLKAYDKCCREYEEFQAYYDKLPIRPRYRLG